MRLVLCNKYRQAGNLNMALACTAAEWEPRTTEFAADSWNGNYSGEFYYALDTLNAAELQSYYQFISGRHKDAFESYVAEHSFRDADYFNDLIGTRLMAENKFEEAIPFLEKVPIRFLNSQNISYYATHRDWTVSRWLQEQNMGEGECDGPQTGKLTENMKLKFCRELLPVAQPASVGLRGPASPAGLSAGSPLRPSLPLRRLLVSHELRLVLRALSGVLAG